MQLVPVDAKIRNVIRRPTFFCGPDGPDGVYADAPGIGRVKKAIRVHDAFIRVIVMAKEAARCN